MRSKTKRRIGALAASTVLCVAGLGVGAGSASAGVTLTTPGGQVVTAPAQATGGAVTAFTRITTNPGNTRNRNPLNIAFSC